MDYDLGLMEDTPQTAQTTTSSPGSNETRPGTDDRIVRVTRHRKRRRSDPNKNRPWHKSKRLRYRLELGGKMLMVVLAVGVVLALIWILYASLSFQ